jgi:hypothetical protein
MPNFFKQLAQGQIRKAFGGKSKAVTPTYAPYTLSAQDLAQQYGTPAGGYGGDPGYQYRPITITDQAILGNPQAREAEIQKQAAFQERQASLQRNQYRERAIGSDFDRLIAENRLAGSQYGDTQRAQLQREASQQVAAAQSNANQRGLGSTTTREAMRRGVYNSYNQARGAMEENLAARQQGVQNALESQRIGFIGGIQDQPMSFSDVAGYGQQPGAVLAAQQAQQFAAEQAKKQRRSQLYGDIAAAAITGAGYAFGGPAGGVAAGAGANALRSSRAQAPDYGQYGGQTPYMGYVPFNPYG